MDQIPARQQHRCTLGSAEGGRQLSINEEPVDFVASSSLPGQGQHGQIEEGQVGLDSVLKGLINPRDR